MRIYIASSWKNQHAVEMLTTKLRRAGHDVLSWVENNYGENHNHVTKKFDFETWVNSKESDQSFTFDTFGAMTCQLFIYVGPAGKDAAAECGMCYGQRLAGKTIPMLGLFAKGEDFGLMRKMFDGWYGRYTELLEAVEKYSKGNLSSPIKIFSSEDTKKILHKHFDLLDDVRLVTPLSEDSLQAAMPINVKVETNNPVTPLPVIHFIYD